MYYAYEVKLTMIVTLNSISADQAKITHATAKNVVKLLNYAATHLTEINRYNTSGIILRMHRNTYFIFSLGTKIISGGYPYLIAPSIPPPPPPRTHTHPPTQWNHPHGMNNNEEYTDKCNGTITGIIIC